MATFLAGQKLMMSWLDLMKNFTPYDSGVGKEAWDIGHERRKKQTAQYLENPDEFVEQVQSLQQLVEEWVARHHENNQWRHCVAKRAQ
jgi:hypothetical protein